MRRVRLSQRDKQIVDTLAGKVPVEVLQALTGRSRPTLNSRARKVGKSLKYYGKGGNVSKQRSNTDTAEISRVKTMLNEGIPPIDVCKATGLNPCIVYGIYSGELHRDIEPALRDLSTKPKNLIDQVFR